MVETGRGPPCWPKSASPPWKGSFGGSSGSGFPRLLGNTQDFGGHCQGGGDGLGRGWTVGKSHVTCWKSLPGRETLGDHSSSSS